MNFSGKSDLNSFQDRSVTHIKVSCCDTEMIFWVVVQLVCLVAVVRANAMAIHIPADISTQDEHRIDESLLSLVEQVTPGLMLHLCRGNDVDLEDFIVSFFLNLCVDVAGERCARSVSYREQV
jgi:hypothetical protein